MNGKHFPGLEAQFLPLRSYSLTLCCSVTGCFERGEGIGVTAHRHELLRTPRPGKHHPNPGTDDRVKPARGDGEKIKNRTGATGCPDKEEKVSE